MSSKNNFNPETINNILGFASKKLNTTPDELRNQLNSGKIDKVINTMPQEDAEKLKKALNDKNTCAKILSSPQAQSIIKKLSGK